MQDKIRELRAKKFKGYVEPKPKENQMGTDDLFDLINEEIDYEWDSDEREE